MNQISKDIHVVMHIALAKSLKTLAIQEGRSVSDIMRALVSDYISSTNKNKPSLVVIKGPPQ